MCMRVWQRESDIETLMTLELWPSVRLLNDSDTSASFLPLVITQAVALSTPLSLSLYFSNLMSLLFDLHLLLSL